jgi:hypothetical protein
MKAEQRTIAMAKKQGAVRNLNLDERTLKKGFVALVLGEATLDMLKRDPKGFLLLTEVAIKAARRDDRWDGLGIGQAMIGPWETNQKGFEEQPYRDAKERLERHGLATFTGTRKCTIATITNRLIYDIGVEKENGQGNGQENGQGTDEERTGNGQGTGNEKREEREEKRDGRTVWRELVGSDSRFERLRGEQWATLYGMWVDHRENSLRAPVTDVSVKLDAMHMLKVLEAGGSHETVFEWIGAAITSISAKGKPWRGWYFSNKFEEWKAGLPAKPMGRQIYRGESSEA